MNLNTNKIFIRRIICFNKIIFSFVANLSSFFEHFGISLSTLEIHAIFFDHPNNEANTLQACIEQLNSLLQSIPKLVASIF